MSEGARVHREQMRGTCSDFPRRETSFRKDPSDAELISLLADDSKSFEASDGLTADGRWPTEFAIGTVLWTKAAKEKNSVPWYMGMVKGGCDVYDRLAQG